MGTPVLTPHIFINNETSAGIYGEFRPIDFRFDEERLRSVSGTRADVNDAVQILLDTIVPIYANDGTVTSELTVTVTATTFTSANGGVNSAVIQGPFTAIRLRKVGAAGAATFVGIV